MNKKPSNPGRKPAASWRRAALWAILVSVAALVIIITSSLDSQPAAAGGFKIFAALLRGPKLQATAAPLAANITTSTPQPTWTPPARLQPSPTPLPATDTPLPPAPQPSPTFNPADWVSLPIIPTVSDTARAIYQKGLALGNRPNVFAKVGDCNSLSVRFLTYFDEDARAYNLESFTYLQPMIDHFNGSFGRQSQAVGNGYNTSAILSPFRADPKVCKGGESPLACEYRLLKPSFAIISIGTDDYLQPAKFEANLRQILETTIAGGIVPILGTKADNANQLNYNPIIARLAVEYDIPLWNLWRAMDPLPGHGLFDNIHPSGEFAAFDFSEDNLKRYGWTVRDLTALQSLDAVWRGVTTP